MGKGKSKTTSKSAYTDTINMCINNTKFSAPEENPNVNHKEKFYTKYFINSNNQLTVTRNPLSINDAQARKKFLRLVSEFESNTELKLSDTSKSELLLLFLDFAETTNSIIHLKDDAMQFLVYKFLFPDIMKLYLYKVFYPRVFDFEIIETTTDTNIIFKSSYIEENFEQIFKNIELICLSIVYDAMLIAVENCSLKHIIEMKKYKATVIPSDSAYTILENLDEEFKASTELRANLIKNFKSSIVFFARYYNYLYKNRQIKEKLITYIIKINAFYAGKRADDSRNALISAYGECSEMLSEDARPFTMLLNMYHINKNSCLYDLNIMKNNIDFMPFALDGIVTKHLIDKMISENSTRLQQKTDNSLNLSSVYNNPNCIISNLSLKDYEMIDFIITHSAKSFEEYYFKTDDADLKTSKVCEIIDCIDEIGYTETMAKIISPFANLQTNNVDYSKVVDWVKPIK